MPHDDWLVGGDRRTVATERIYDAATDLITREGPDAFDIDTLAARVHCSRGHHLSVRRRQSRDPRRGRSPCGSPHR